ncbi:MAG: NAD-dependent epimerase/dehydratase family protein, partial [Anaerolineaceae bacterium]|nr:NAD-dependent epimerase/dehydratase family protein [Anaerolineaceae bacterium]
MILITGGTGFIGSRIILRLVQAKIPVKVLLSPKNGTINLPHDLTLNAAVSSLKDRRSLRAILSDVTLILHFASSENKKPLPDFENVDVLGTEVLVKAAIDAGVKQIFYLSRIGADVNSMYPIFRAKGMAEQMIRNSGLSFTILRLSDVFGENDHFTNSLASYIRSAPGFIPLPEGGETMLQPLWIEDLISLIILILEKKLFNNIIYT